MAKNGSLRKSNISSRGRRKLEPRCLISFLSFEVHVLLFELLIRCDSRYLPCCNYRLKEGINKKVTLIGNLDDTDEAYFLASLAASASRALAVLLFLLSVNSMPFSSRNCWRYFSASTSLLCSSSTS